MRAASFCRSFADLVNGEDVGMVERRGCLRFAFKTAHAIRILGEGGGQQFECDLAFEPGVLDQEYFSHSAPPKPADDFVRPDAAPDQRFIAIIRERRSLHKDGRLNEAALPLVSGDQSLGLLAQLLVAAAHLRQKGRPRFSLKLQSLVEQSIQFFPAFGCHGYELLISLRSQARAMLQSRLTVAGEIWS